MKQSPAASPQKAVRLPCFPQSISSSLLSCPSPTLTSTDAVCINDVSANQAGIDSLTADLNKQHGEGSAVGVAADVTSGAEVESLVQKSVEALGPLTVMVANAGIAQVAPMLEISDSDVERMFGVNFMGVWHCYTKAAKQMIAQGPVPEGSTGYKIIGAASIVAFKPFPLLSHYSASKWAVRGLTQVTAMELAKYNIQVNAYAPGIGKRDAKRRGRSMYANPCAVGTAMWDLIDEKLGEQEGRAKGESVKKYSSDLTAMGRVSVPDDVAKVVGGFLAGKDSDFVTGQTIVVDGGIVSLYLSSCLKRERLMSSRFLPRCIQREVSDKELSRSPLPTKIWP